jgi:hypothetical protein
MQLNIGKAMPKLPALPYALVLFVGLAQSQTIDPTTMDHYNMDHAAHMKMMADAQRQSEVAERGKDVMPFSLPATTHIFSKTPEGGVQQVIAKKADDAAQVKLIRQHLQEIRVQFLKGDFSGPSHIHGKDMPGLAELREAKPGQVDIAYKDVQSGAELTYKTANASLVVALHKWFDAQLSDHGKDAKEGHANHEGMVKQ